MAVALRHAAPLKPEIRLAQAISEYESLLDDDQKATMRNDRTGQPSRPLDVTRLTAEIDRRTSSRKSRCVGTRLTNILQCLQQFSAVVDTVVGGSQSLIASGIWAAFKLTLFAALGWASYFEKLSSLLMDVGRSCPRYQELGVLYASSKALRKVLCEYMVLVIDLCKKAILFLQRPVYAQVSTFWKTFETEFSHFKGSLISVADAVRMEVNIASAKEQQLEIKDNATFRSFVGKFSDKVARELAEVNGLRRRKNKMQFLDACSSYKYDTAWKQARKSGTTNWMHENQQYKQWYEAGKSSMLCCTGSLGVGKTVLSANVVEKISIQTSTAGIGYFFCRFDDADSLQSRTIIGSVVRQLLEPLETDAFNYLGSRTSSELDEGQMLNQLQRLLPVHQQRYFVVLDGLDECSPSELKNTVRFMRGLMEGAHEIHLFCSCRQGLYQDIAGILEPQYHVSCTQSNVRPEITQHIEDALAELIESGELALGDPTLILTIRDALVNGNQGMFLWLVFQLSSICLEATDEAILEGLKHLPRDLPETFERILQKMNRGNDISQDLYRKVFEVVAASQRPLTLQELREAASVVPGETVWDPQRLVNDIQRTVNFCGGLLRVDEEHLTVHFAHHSVKQYLLASCSKTSDCGYHMDASIADQAVGEICVTYLHFDHLGAQLIQVNATSSLQAKTLPSVIVHRALPPSVISRTALKLLKGEARLEFDISAQLKRVNDSSAGKRDDAQLGQTFLAYAQEYWLFHSRRFSPDTGVYNLWRGLVNGQKPTASPPWRQAGGQTVELWEWAVLNDHRALCQWVIPKTFSEKTFWEDVGSPRERLESLLLKTAGNPSISDSMIIATVFNLAVISECYGASTLLPTVADTEALDVWGHKLLSTAAAVGDERAFDMLVTQGADLNARDSAGRTALFRAIEERQEWMVRLLLERDGVDVNIPDRELRSPLSLAANLSDDHILKLLLARTDLNVQAADITGQPLIFTAVHFGHMEAALLMLDHPNSPKDWSMLWNPYTRELLLMVAVKKGYTSIVQVLLERHPDTVNWKDGDGLTAASVAVKEGEADMVKLLLRCGDVDMHTRDNHGWTLFDLAIRRGNNDVVELLEWHQWTRRSIIQSTANLPSPQSEPPWVPPTDKSLLKHALRH
ncbi:hypothetical protein H2202_010454 [Exophiala xenobiotica]|nr:hypothetical protein H2202_010454 [Exophiala xenobiotica]